MFLIQRSDTKTSNNGWRLAKGLNYQAQNTREKRVVIKTAKWN